MHRNLHILLVALVAAGLALHGYVAIVESAGGLTTFSAGLLAWSSLPYMAASLFAMLAREPLVGVVPAALVLLVDGWTYHAVFIRPTSSTAALALLWMPLWNLVLVVPVVAGLVWIWRRSHPRDPHAT